MRPFPRIVRRRHLAGATLAVISVLAVNPVRAQGGGGIVPDQVALTALRLLYPNYTGVPRTYDAGVVPPEVAATIVIPSDVTVAGAIVWPTGAAVLGAATGSADALLTEFRSAMTAKGWTTVGVGTVSVGRNYVVVGPTGQGGPPQVVADHRPAANHDPAVIDLCRGQKRASLTVVAGDDGILIVSLTTNDSKDTACERP